MRCTVSVQTPLTARHGLTLVETLVSIGIATVLTGLLVPAVQSARESSRRTTCRDHLRQITLASHAYAATHSTFPYTSLAWISRDGQRHSSESPHAALLPFIDGTETGPFGETAHLVPLWNNQWPPSFGRPEQTALQNRRFEVFGCPSDNQEAGSTNYRANVGISAFLLPRSSGGRLDSGLGAFINGSAVRPEEIIDGLSNTALFSERVLGDFSPADYSPFRDIFADGTVPASTNDFRNHCRRHAVMFPPQHFSFAGGSWLFGGLLHSWYLHATSPNSPIPDCSVGSGIVDGGPGIVAARSLHSGLVHVGFADGSVRMIANDVSQAVWTSIGTRNGSESATQ